MRNLVAALAMLLLAAASSGSEAAGPSAIQSLMAAAGTPQVKVAGDPPPEVVIENALPDGYVITAAGVNFSYRRGSSEEEGVYKEDIYVQPGHKVILKGTRRDCCKFALIGLDVLLPNGTKVPVFGTDSAKPGECIRRTYVKLEPETALMRLTEIDHN